MRAIRRRVPFGAAWMLAIVLVTPTARAAESRDGTVEGQHAVAQVSRTHYIDIHSDLLYTHNGDNRLWGPEHDLAQDNIQARLVAYGLDTTLHPFVYGGTTFYNVVGEQAGTTRPGDIYILGAHYDSAALGDGWELIGNPGADDNATGVAAVLEIARLVSQWEAEATIRFIAFDREEEWMIGSYAYALDHASDNICGMLALDMLAHPRFGPTAEIYGESASNGVKYALADALSAYTDIQPIVLGPIADDHIPFEELGFQAALFIEPDPYGNPYIHTLEDSLDTPNYIDYDYATALTRGVMGWLVAAAGVTPQHPPGDMNCDATVDARDINPFVLALSDPARYAAAYPDCHRDNADMNADDQVDFADINPFMALFLAACSGPQAVAELWSTDTPEDLLGTSVSLNGDVAAVGSNASNLGAWSGSVSVFERAGTTWARTAKLTTPSGQELDYFGQCVALDGNTLLAGASGDSDAAPYAGAVYVFEQVNGTWTQTGKLTASDGATFDAFGQAPALSGDTAVIGAPGVDGTDVDQGAVYVFQRAGGTWTQTAKLTASDPAYLDTFGYSVALRGDTAVVGAIYHNGGRGAAYVFERISGSWVQVAELAAADGIPDDQLGYAVSVDGNTLVAAAHRQSSGAGRTMVYVYECVGGIWSQSAKLGTWSHTSGASVAVEGDTILVGRDGGNWPADGGTVYVFRPVNEEWTRIAQLGAWDGGQVESFGAAVSLSGSTAVVGAPLHFETPACGAAYVFELNGDGVPWVARPPADQAVDVGASAMFSVAAVGPGELSYRWRKDGQRLVDNERVSGAATATLTINAVGLEDAGVYDVSIGGPCGSIIGGPATLTVTEPASTR
jgi:hypothetical protein